MVPAVFNVCTGTPTAVAALARLIARCAGRDAAIGFGPPRAGEIRHSVGDPAPADAALGLATRTALADGLAEVLAWLDVSH